jgi:hypothetical protein
VHHVRVSAGGYNPVHQRQLPPPRNISHHLHTPTRPRDRTFQAKGASAGNKCHPTRTPWFHSKFYNIVLTFRTICRRLFYATYYTFTNFCPVLQSCCPVRRQFTLMLEVAPFRVQPNISPPSLMLPIASCRATGTTRPGTYKAASPTVCDASIPTRSFT